MEKTHCLPWVPLPGRKWTALENKCVKKFLCQSLIDDLLWLGELEGGQQIQGENNVRVVNKLAYFVTAISKLSQIAVSIAVNEMDYWAW